jgi:L-fucose isomerase-like protein
MNNDIKFGFIPVSSTTTQMSAEMIASDLLQSFHGLGGKQVPEESIDHPFPIFILVLTGGTEEKILRLWNTRKSAFPGEPIILVAHPGNNSLPASLEILARLQQEGKKGKIIYLDGSTKKEWQCELEQVIKYRNIFQKLQESKIGLIGAPSDWLVASTPPYATVKNVWGPEIIPIALQEVITRIAQIKDQQIDNDYSGFTTTASEIKEPSTIELLHVVKIYFVLRELITIYGLTSLSIRCFDLVTNLHTTGCFALSKLNDDGIVAGCEGDLVSTIGMLWAHFMTDKVVWMANPVQIDEADNSIWLAHCTVPMSMVENYKLRSHFESGLGVGIQGELSKGEVTVFRIGGKDLDQLWLSDGDVLESGSSENVCRTQVKVKLHESEKVSELLNSPLGNHLLLLHGSHAKDLLAWWKMFIG